MDKTVTLRLVAQTSEMKAAMQAAKAELAGLGNAAEKVGTASAAGSRQVGIAASTGAAAMQKLSASAQGAAASMSNVGQRAAQAALETGRAAQQAGAQTAQGMAQAEQATEKAGRAASIGAQAYDRLKQAAYGYVSLRVGQQIIAEADAYANLSSKLRLVSEGEAGLASIRQKVFDLSQRTRTDFNTTAELYARLTRSTEQLGLAESQRLQITETVNKALKVSGATTAEATAAITQLSQGLASGTLRGEEFNSIAEQAPILLDLVAKRLGVTRGELRGMAADGKITAEVMAGALLDGAREVDLQFAQLAPTIADAAQQIKNSWTLAIGELFGDSNQELAEFLKYFAEGVAELPQTLRQAFTSAFGYVDRFYTDSAESLSLLLDAALSTWVAIKQGLYAMLAALRSGIAETLDYAQEAFSGVARSFADAASYLGLSGLAESQQEFAYALENGTTRTAELAAETEKANKQFEAQLKTIRANSEATIDKAEADRQASLDASTLGKQTLAASKAADASTIAFKASTKAVDEHGRVAKENAEAWRIQTERIQMANAGQELFEQHQQKLTAAADRQADAIARSNKGLDDYLRNLDDETRLLGLTGDAREEAARQIEAEGVFRRRLNELLAAGVPAMWAIVAAQQAYNDALAGLEARDAAGEFDKIRQSVDRLGDAMNDAIGELLSGGSDIESFFERLGDNSQQFWSNMISDSIKAGDSLEEFFKKAAAGAALKNPDGTWSMGGIANAAGSGVNLYQAYKEGNPLSGAASGAALGASIGSVVPVIGTAIGAIVGAVVGLIAGIFGGPSTPDLRLGATGIVRKPEQGFNTDLGSLQIGVRGGTNASEFIKLVTEFDAGMADLIGSFRNGADQLDAVQTALRSWAVDMKGEISSEEVLSSRFSAILATFNSDVQAFVGTSGKLEERIQRLGEAAFIDAAAASGELLDSFTPLANLLTEYRQGTEDLGQTYGRLLEATLSLEAASGITGVAFAANREAFIRFAADIAEAAGGVQQASALWDNYFQTFYDADERREIAQAQALQTRNAALQALGLEATISAAAFREQFEAALPTLSPAEIVQWLRAGAAIANYSATLETVEESSNAAAEALAGVYTSLDQFAAGLSDQFTTLARADLSDFQRELLEIDDGLRDNVSQLQAWRRQIVANGGSAEDLARVDGLLGRAHELAAAQAARAITMLRNAGRSLVQQLMGGDGNASTVSNAADDMAQQGVSAFETIGQAAEDLARQQLAAMQQIREYLDSQLLGNISSLTPGQQYAEAQSQFAEMLAAAQGGDMGALQNITGLAQTLLEMGRERFAGGAEYVTLEASVRAALQSLLGLQTPGATPGTPGAIGYTGTGYGLQQGVQEFGQQATENRLELAQQISEIVRDLLLATGESLTEVAASLGLNLNDLIGALGISLTDLSVSTATSLADVARTMGVELGDLAQQVGVDLGSLANAQSLLNDAVEAAIGDLPQEQRDRLQPLLEAVEYAAATGGPELVENAIQALENETRRIGGSAAAALAPFLAGIDPTDPLESIDGVLRAGFAQEFSVLDEIRRAIESLAPVVPIPINPNPTTARASSRSVSVPFVGSPVQALASVGAQQQDSQLQREVLAELKRLTAEVVELRKTNSAGLASVASETKNTGKDLARAYENSARDIKRTVMG